ncbi:SKI2-family helicase [Sulfobacillus acidophilus TPY]|nr:SKI2-family helicase [Sulfobacillus acidophilus TPY]
MIESKLAYWVAQSKSWHTFKEFKLSIENQADYPFLGHPKDFYITLFGKMFELIHKDPSEENAALNRIKNQMLQIAKGMEIYSLKETRSEFQGVDFSRNMLYVASLYYLADYPASAYILAKLFPPTVYEGEVDQFISSFLCRDLDHLPTFADPFARFVLTGKRENLEGLSATLHDGSVKARDPDEFVSFRIAEALVKSFMANNVWQDLADRFDVLTEERWKQFIRHGFDRRPPVWSFFPSQRQAIAQGILSEDARCFALQMPTSAGKTALCELIIFNHILQKPGKVLFLAPYRALASELLSGFGRRLATLGISSKAMYGGHVPNNEERAAIQDVDVLIATPEMFLAVESVIPEVYESFSLVICDEGHLLDDTTRGLNYELLLAKFKLRSPNARFVFLSAVVPNINEINQWLGGNESVVRSNYRPTELDLAYLQKTARNGYMLNFNPHKRRPENYQLYHFLTRGDMEFVNIQTGRINHYRLETSVTRQSVATAMKALLAGKVALFSPHKRKNGVESLAEKLIRQTISSSLPKPIEFADSTMIERLQEYFGRVFGKDYLLTRLVRVGALYHHGDLPQNIREVVESAIHTSAFRLLICTNTLAEGVNLPIKVVVIHSARRFDKYTGTLKPLKLRDLANLFGRAGRSGQETTGMVIVVNPVDRQIVSDAIEGTKNEAVSGYLFGLIENLERVIREHRLVLDNRLLESQSEDFLRLLDSIDVSLISLLAEEIDVDHLTREINTLIQSTFAYHQGDSEQRDTLRAIFKSRGERLVPYVQNGQFKAIKNSGATLRFFEQVVHRLHLEDEVWSKTTHPCDDRWMAHLFDILFSLPQIIATVDDFNTGRSKDEMAVDATVIRDICTLWMKGHWYGEIATRLNVEVSYLLRIFSSIVHSTIGTYVAQIIRLASYLSEHEVGISISETILDWPQYLMSGLQYKTELELVNLGFTEREGVIAIARWMALNNVQGFSGPALKSWLVLFEDKLLAEIKDLITTVAYDKSAKDFDLLRHQPIL